MSENEGSAIAARKAEFLGSLRRKGVKLWVSNDRLHYRAPKDTLTETELMTLRDMKSGIIDVLSHYATIVGPARAIQRPVPGPAPLTFQQESYWRFIKRNPARNRLGARALRVYGRFSTETFTSCIRELRRRHESLRTRIVLIDDVPNQWIDESCESRPETVDLSDISAAETSGALKNITNEISNKECDLSIDPMFDARIVKLTEREHLLIFAIHHMITDGCSLSLMFREFWTLYNEFFRGQPSSLGPVPMQCADYAIWQRSVQNDLFAKNEYYWKERLAGVPGIRWQAPLLTRVRNSSAVASPVSFGKTLTDEIHNFARHAQTLPSMVVLAVYAATVARWCNQRDFIVNTTITGRDYPEHENIIGYLAEILSLRVQLSDFKTFDQLVRQIAREFCQGLSHRTFGGKVMQGEVQDVGSLFQWLPWQLDEIAFPSSDVLGQLDIAVEKFTVRRIEDVGLPDTFDVMVLLWEEVKGICGIVVCQSNALPGEAVARFASALRSTAESLLGSPYAPVLGRDSAER